MKLLRLTFLLILFYSCSPLKKVIIDTSLKPLSDSTEVVVVDIKHPMPDSCKLAGTLRYTENINSPAQGYNQLIQSAKKEARAMGGNIIKVTDLQVTGSYVLSISVLYRQHLTNIDNRLKAIKDSLHIIKFGSGNPTYAILYVYRPSGEGYLIGYDVVLNDKVICRAKDNSCYELKLYQEGSANIIAQTESPAFARIDVKFGEEYYLKCSVKTGIAIAGPVLELMPNWQGHAEYEQLKKTLTKRQQSRKQAETEDSGN